MDSDIGIINRFNEVKKTERRFLKWKKWTEESYCWLV